MWRPWFSGWPTRPRGTGLADVHTPTLLIVGGHDPIVLALNRHAQTQLAPAESDIAVVPGATHLFEEPGALLAVADLASAWFVRHFTSGCTTPPGRREAGDPQAN
jgi:putative phosphoribosyl transferase